MSRKPMRPLAINETSAPLPAPVLGDITATLPEQGPDRFFGDEALHPAPVLERRRPTRRARVSRQMTLLTSFVVAFAGVAMPNLAQAQENPKPTTASWLSQSDNNPCEVKVDLPTGTLTVAEIIAKAKRKGGGPKVLDAARKLLPAKNYIDLAMCWDYLNSKSRHKPYSPPVQEGATCYSDIEGRHPVGIYRNGQCVQPQPELQQPPEKAPPQKSGGYRFPCLLPDGMQGEVNNTTGTCGPVQ